MPARIDPFHAVLINWRANALQAEGRDVIHMEVGQPSTGAPPAAIARAKDVLDSDAMGYWESPALKARIAKRYADDHGIRVDPSRVFLTCGASPALVLALTLGFDPGDRIAFGCPGYVAYRNTVKALGLEPVELNCGPESRFQLSAAMLDTLDPALHGVIISSPANPTGTVIPGDELKRIADVCQRRGIRIISDEIYHGLTFGDAARSMLEFAPDATIINSFSKYYSMVGWRLGWILVPQGAEIAADAHLNNMFLTAPSLSQHAGLVAMDETAILERQVDVYRRNREILLDALPALGLDQIAPPDGAFYIYANIANFTPDSLSFCQRLLEDTGVATAPGIDFDPINGRHHMRLSFAVSTNEIDEALSRLKPWFAAQSLS